MEDLQHLLTLAAIATEIAAATFFCIAFPLYVLRRLESEKAFFQQHSQKNLELRSKKYRSSNHAPGMALSCDRPKPAIAAQSESIAADTLRNNTAAFSHDVEAFSHHQAVVSPKVEPLTVKVDRSSNPYPGNDFTSNCQLKAPLEAEMSCDRGLGVTAAQSQTEKQKRAAIDSKTKSPENLEPSKKLLHSATEAEPERQPLPISLEPESQKRKRGRPRKVA